MSKVVEKNTETIEELKAFLQALTDFKNEEYENDDCITDIKLTEYCPIAFTTLGDDEELEIQVSIHPIDLTIKTEITGVGVDEVNIHSLPDLKTATEMFNNENYTLFDDLVYYYHGFDIDELVEQSNQSA